MAANVLGLPPVDWISRSGQTKLTFSLNQEEVIAALFQINTNNEFIKKYDIKEKDMTIERYNVMELMRGMRQTTYKMSQLSIDQKQAVLGSLSSRNIEIINTGPHSGRLNILALP